MAKKAGEQAFQLPKDALRRVTLGESFAEYDLVRKNPHLYVDTPSLQAANDKLGSKCIFVGRRGTGKTATTFFLQQKDGKQTILLLPSMFSVIDAIAKDRDFSDVHQRPFKTVVGAFKRSLLDEVVKKWLENGAYTFRGSGSGEINRERNEIEQDEFDTRVLDFLEEGLDALTQGREKDWNKLDGRIKRLADEVGADGVAPSTSIVVLIDRIDEDWNGSNTAVTALMALLHAVVELNSTLPRIRFLIFIRENMFDRVRELDKEFARLETAVVSLEWTKELLREFIERRLRMHLITKPALGGPTWQAFFRDESTVSSMDIVFQYCQFRPRDVLTYCVFAVDDAKAKQHSQIHIEDLLSARKRFSESRLKELADEYAENYPQLIKVLEKFFGLGRRFTFPAIEDLIKKLLQDHEVKSSCASWIFKSSTPDRFVSLLYGIGFFGIENRNKPPNFKLHETQPLQPTDITADSIAVVHSTYVDALQLQDLIVTRLAANVDLRAEGTLVDIPDAFDADEYTEKLESLQEDLKSLPTGPPGATQFEDLVGELVRLCFFKSLANVEPKSRDIDGRVIRDWIAGNHATGGFWQMVQQAYGANQIVFECKNYSAIGAEDFQQAAYYMNEQIGRFCIIASRARELSKTSIEHVRRIAQEKKGMIVILGENDLFILLRQAIKGKNSDSHLRNLFDRMVRLIS